MLKERPQNTSRGGLCRPTPGRRGPQFSERMALQEKGPCVLWGRMGGHVPRGQGTGLGGGGGKCRAGGGGGGSRGFRVWGHRDQTEARGAGSIPSTPRAVRGLAPGGRRPLGCCSLWRVQGTAGLAPPPALSTPTAQGGLSDAPMHPGALPGALGDPLPDRPLPPALGFCRPHPHQNPRSYRGRPAAPRAGQGEEAAEGSQCQERFPRGQAPPVSALFRTCVWRHQRDRKGARFRCGPGAPGSPGGGGGGKPGGQTLAF